MDRREFIGTVVGSLLAAPLDPEAQQSSQMIEEAQLPCGLRRKVSTP